MNSNEKYKDIIGLPRHVSAKHPQMPIENRAAQFAPFAALSGFEALIEEATDSFEFCENVSYVDIDDL